MSQDRTLISIAIPCYCSESILAITVENVITQFAGQDHYACELILVNDGSKDDTWGSIQALCVKYPFITGVNLTRNYGQEGAKLAALQYVSGKYLVYMDDDGQHPAEGIFPLIEQLRLGSDVCFAAFTNKEHSRFRRCAANANYWLLTKTIGLTKGIRISAFYAITDYIVRELKNYHSPFPDALGYMLQLTDKLSNVVMPHQKRIKGKSGYTLKQLIHFSFNELMSFSIVPLRLASISGLIVALIGFIAGLTVIIQKLLNPMMPMGYASTMSALLFIGGVIMGMLGILGEYVGRIFMTISNKPQFTVREVRRNAAP